MNELTDVESLRHELAETRAALLRILDAGGRKNAALAAFITRRGTHRGRGDPLFQEYLRREEDYAQAVGEAAKLLSGPPKVEMAASSDWTLEVDDGSEG